MSDADGAGRDMELSEMRVRATTSVENRDFGGCSLVDAPEIVALECRHVGTSAAHKPPQRLGNCHKRLDLEGVHWSWYISRGVSRAVLADWNWTYPPPRDRDMARTADTGADSETTYTLACARCGESLSWRECEDHWRTIDQLLDGALANGLDRIDIKMLRAALFPRR